MSKRLAEGRPQRSQEDPAQPHGASVAASASVTSGGAAAPGGTLLVRVEHILNLIRPAVQSDGGDLELISVSDDGVVQVRLHGACVGCPSSTLTLQAGIERNLRQHVPEIRSVVAVA
jgi:Fe-S cluster biogenesis protein NfuA